MMLNINSRNIMMFCLAITVAISACAQTKKKTSNNKRTLKQSARPILLQATKQRTNPGREETPSTDDYRFVIVWQSRVEPSAFFWRGEQSWQACNINKIANFKPLVVKDNGMPQAMNYEYQKMSTIAYQKGDTLELYPENEGKHPMPDELATDKHNIIYYKEANGKWQALPVEKITKLPTVSMP